MRCASLPLESWILFEKLFFEVLKKRKYREPLIQAALGIRAEGWLMPKGSAVRIADKAGLLGAHALILAFSFQKMAKWALQFKMDYGILFSEYQNHTWTKEECGVQELKRIVAQNIAALRTKAHLTQFELGEKLRYSDKAVSRWERAEAVPDAYVLLMLADIFGVTVDYLLKEHSDEELLDEAAEACFQTGGEKAEKKKKGLTNCGVITLLSFLGVWTLALLIFVITAIVKKPFWLIFVYAVPVSFVVLVVFNSIWGKRTLNILYISVLMWGVLTSIHLSLLSYNLWMIYLIGLPAQIIIPFSFKIHRRPPEEERSKK